MSPTQANIPIRALFANLQHRQDEHDEQCHRDIARLPARERLAHLGLHLLKYAGRFQRGLRGDPALFEQGLVDAFIIITSAANVLSVFLLEEISKLDSSVRNYLDSPSANLNGLAEALSNAAVSQAGADSAELCVSYFIQEAGEFAKALESLEHLENAGMPSLIREAVAKMATALLRCAGTQRIDLFEKVRLRQVKVREQGFNRRRLGMSDVLLER